MTDDELQNLPAVVPLLTAGQAWGMSATATYRLNSPRSDTGLPFRVRRIGGTCKVAKADLLESLGMTHLLAGPAPEPEPEREPAPSAAPSPATTLQDVPPETGQERRGYVVVVVPAGEGQLLDLLDRLRSAAEPGPPGR